MRSGWVWSQGDVDNFTISAYRQVMATPTQIKTRDLQAGWTKDVTITRLPDGEDRWVIMNADGGGEDYGTLFECLESWAEPLAGYSMRLVEIPGGWEGWSRDDEDGVWYSGAWWVLELNRVYAEREGLSAYVAEHPWMTREEALRFREVEVGVPCIAVQIGEREIQMLNDATDEN
jgi:hypothetical protein